MSLVALTVPLDPITPIMSEMDGPAWVDVLLAVLVLAYTTVGAFVAARRPGNLIGWIFCGAGSLIKFGLYFRAYADYTLSAGAGPVTVAQYLAWLASQLASPVVALATLLLTLLFPSGRLPSGLLLSEVREPARCW